MTSRLLKLGGTDNETSTGSRLSQLPAKQPVLETITQKPSSTGFISSIKNAPKNMKALFTGEIGVSDVLKEVPGATKQTASGFTDLFIPAIKKFTLTTGSILGEGIAYAVDKDVRKQYTSADTAGDDKIIQLIQNKRAKGEDVSRLMSQLRVSQKNERVDNLDILPTITNTTQTDLARYTVAAGIETAVYKSFPKIAESKLLARGGFGAIQGVGFAISTGLAEDKSAEEIIKSLPLYGVSGGAVGVITPYLLPLLKAEIKQLPNEIKGVFKGLKTEIKPPQPKKIGVVSQTPEPTKVPISTPNQRYEAYLRSQGYEPYIPNKNLPDIQVGNKPKINGLDIENLQSPKVSKTNIFNKEVSNVLPDEIKPRTTTVPREQLPVGEGKIKASRLETRLRGVLDEVNPSTLKENNLTSFNQMNKANQMQKAVQFVDNNIDDALAVVRGEKPAPEGLLDNSIALALAKKAEVEGDASLAVKLASLRSTRAGQEISILTEADPLGAVTQINEVIKARAGKVTRKLKSGNTVQKEVAKAEKEVKQILSKEHLKIEEAEKILANLAC